MDEDDIERRLRSAWDKLRPEHQPNDPDALIEILMPVVTWPGTGEPIDSNTKPAEIRAINDQWDTLAEAARRLMRLLPSSEHWNTLAIVLQERMPADIEPYLFEKVGEAISAIASVPILRPAGSSRVGAPSKDNFIKAVARCAFYYCQHIEGCPLSTAVERVSNIPTGKAGILAHATTEALEMPLEGTWSSVLQAVHRDGVWRQYPMTLADMLPKIGKELATKNPSKLLPPN